MTTNSGPSGESWDYAELLESEYQYEPWMVEGLITEATQALFIGPSGIGKSIFLQHLSHALTNGIDFLGMQIPTPRKVLYIQSEGSLNETTLRGRAMAPLTPAPPKGTMRMEYLLRGRINTPQGKRGLMELCDRFELDNGLVIIDSLYPTIRGGMKDESPASDYTSNLNDVIHKFHSTVLVAHHEHRPYRNPEGKMVKEETGKAFFGSFVWEAWTTYGLQIGYTKGRQSITIANWKNRRPTFLEDEPLNIHMVEPYPLGFIIPENEELTRMDSSVLAFLRMQEEWIPKAGIIEELSKGRKVKRQTAVQDAIAHLDSMGYLESMEYHKGGRGRPALHYKIRDDKRDNNDTSNTEAASSI
jgi:hypothetical protein